MRDATIEELYNRPHFHAKNHPYMSRHDRAAQFMPFKSLNGYHEKVEEKETETLQEEWQVIEYDEDYFDF